MYGPKGSKDRFLDVDMFTSPADDRQAQRPESGICHCALIHSSEAGKREATHRLRRRPGQSGPRLPRRSAGPLRHPARPSRSSWPSIDIDGKPTTGRFTFKDKAGECLSAAGQASGSRLLLPAAGLPPDGGIVLAAAGRVDHDLWPGAGVSPASEVDHRSREGRP